MEILGHSQISVTMEFYTDVLDETEREALEKVADLFSFSPVAVNIDVKRQQR
jgi:integrase